jgi:hypothetical protein
MWKLLLNILIAVRALPMTLHFLSKAAPDLNTFAEATLSQRPERLDMLIVSSTDRVIIELKRARGETQRRIREGILQLTNFMTLSGISQAILYTYVSPNNGKILKREHKVEGINGRIIDLSTE